MPIEPIGPVVVGVDGSAESLAALDLAADEAAGRVTPLVVVHAYSGFRQPAVVPEWVQTREASQQLLASAVGRVSAEHPCLAVEGDLVAGDPAQALIARSEEASLVVVGHRRGGFSHGILGWVAPRVAALAATPVLVHRPLRTGEAVESPRPVLLALDGLAGSEPLVEYAFAAAAMRGAPLIAMHVWPQPPGSAPAGSHQTTYGYADEQEEADLMLAEALDVWSSKYPEVPVRRAARRSVNAVRVLWEASLKAQLLVVGRSRQRGRARLLLGEVSHAMVHGAGCPVVVIP